jgi:hypothetical protein
VSRLYLLFALLWPVAAGSLGCKSDGEPHAVEPARRADLETIAARLASEPGAPAPFGTLLLSLPKGLASPERLGRAVDLVRQAVQSCGDSKLQTVPIDRELTFTLDLEGPRVSASVSAESTPGAHCIAAALRGGELLSGVDGVHTVHIRIQPEGVQQ